MPLKLMASILLCVGSVAGAGTNAWTPIGPESGSVRQMVYGSPAGTAFAATSSGFYRTQDGGSTWLAVKTDFYNAPNGVAVDPSDPLRVYIVAPDWPCLYVSTDGGLTLSAVATLPTAVAQAWQVVVSQDGRTIFVSSAARIFRSVDRGLTWTERTPVATDPGARITRMVMDPADASRVYLMATLDSGNSGLLRTQDGGQSWEVLLAGAWATFGGRDIAVSPANPQIVWATTFNGLYRSVDRGSTWTNTRPGEAYAAVGVSPANPDVVFAGQSSGAVIRSTDSGAQWTAPSAGTGAGQVQSIAVSPSQSSNVLLGGLAGLYGSSDSGATWSAQQTGILGSSIAGISGVASTGRIYINASASGIHYTTSSTAAVVPVNNGGLVQLLQTAPQPLGITAMLAQPGRIFASLSTGLARSLDNGNTWALLQVAPTGTRQLFSIESPEVEPQTLLAAGATRLFRSTDGGSLWTQVTAGIPGNANFGAVKFAPTDARLAYASLYEAPIGPIIPLGIFRSVNGGLNWSAASGNATGDPWLLAVDPVVGTTLYGSTSTSLLKSTNGGVSWSALNWIHSEWRGSIDDLAVDPRRSQTLYAASSVRIARSLDGGTTWETLRGVNELPIWSGVLHVDAGTAGTLYMGTTSHGVQRITIAPDLVLGGVAPGVPTGLGVPLVFRFPFANQGPFDASGVRVNVQWPASATNVAVSSSSGTCVVAATSAACSLEIFRNGSNAILTITATPVGTGPFEVQASISGNESDAKAIDNSLALQAGVTARADLSVAISGTSAVQAGGGTSHTLTVRNAGPNTAATPILDFQLGNGLVVSTATSTHGTCNVSAVAGLVTCALPDLASGATASIAVSSNVPAAGFWTSRAQVSSATPDGSAADNSASTNTDVTPLPSSPGGGGGGSAGAGSGGGGAFSLWEILALMLARGFLSITKARQIQENFRR